ncbi:MAG: flagellar P-ring protein FlgI [Sulfuricurvum sp. PC08-66]|nr:MAG: flagellar P-ring protein FlgI [Sulfuricurvum sp. PC08-66]
MKRILFLLFSTLFFLHSAKISEISKIVGVRDNQLIGYGLVIGLNGSGDGGSLFTQQSLSNMLKSMNVQIDANDIKSKNVAAVVVTAQFDSFARQGDKLDITISSIGDAKSLEGGTLLLTSLKAVDGKIYALAQGAVTIGGKNGRGRGDLNHPTAAKVLSGATVEREMSYDLFHQEYATISLNETNFQNAIGVQESLNTHFGTQIAVALDPKTIKIKRPEGMSMVEFLAKVQMLELEYDRPQKIIIDERTGTIVAGIGVEVLPVVITHGDITIKIDEQESIAPNQGDVALDAQTSLALGSNTITTQKGTSTVATIARSLQKLGAKPKDIIAILQAIKKAGAIKASLEII